MPGNVLDMTYVSLCSTLVEKLLQLWPINNSVTIEPVQKAIVPPYYGPVRTKKSSFGSNLVKFIAAPFTVLSGEALFLGINQIGNQGSKGTSGYTIATVTRSGQSVTAPSRNDLTSAIKSFFRSQGIDLNDSTTKVTKSGLINFLAAASAFVCQHIRIIVAQDVSCSNDDNPENVVSYVYDPSGAAGNAPASDKVATILKNPCFQNLLSWSNTSNVVSFVVGSALNQVSTRSSINYAVSGTSSSCSSSSCSSSSCSSLFIAYQKISII